MIFEPTQTFSSAAMSYSKKSSSNGAVNRSPMQSTSLSSSSANTVQQDPASNASFGMQNGAIVPGNQRSDYTPKECLDVSIVNTTAKLKF